MTLTDPDRSVFAIELGTLLGIDTLANANDSLSRRLPRSVRYTAAKDVDLSLSATLASSLFSPSSARRACLSLSLSLFATFAGAEGRNLRKLAGR